MHEIEAQGKIVEVMTREVFRAELPNGHVCVARPAKGVADDFAVGDAIVLAFSPADLSRARILRRP